MTLKRHKIDLLSAFQPKQKNLVNSFLPSGARGIDAGNINSSVNLPVAGPLPGVSMDNGGILPHVKDKTDHLAPLYDQSKRHDTKQEVGSSPRPHRKIDVPEKPDKKHRHGHKKKNKKSRIYDDPAVVAGYTSVPLLDSVSLPRGGLTIETKAVGRIQFGIPPETIKDSMRLGLDIPNIYIVPVERFCREMGPALGINLAEFEFPGYFNYFVRGRKVTLVVDSDEAETNIRNVFGETLLGPAQFRNHEYPKANEDEDFDPIFPEDQRPNFYREFYHFRTAEKSTDYKELNIDTLIGFVHFQPNQEDRDNIKSTNTRIGLPPVKEKFEASRRLSATGKTVRIADGKDDHSDPGAGAGANKRRSISVNDLEALSLHGMEGSSSKMRAQRRGSTESSSSLMSSSSYDASSSWTDAASVQADESGTPRTTWMFSQVRWLGDIATVYPPDVTPEQRRTNKTKRVEIFKMPGGTEYVIHDVNDDGVIVGKARFSGTVKVPDEIAVEGFMVPGDAMDDAASGTPSDIEIGATIETKSYDCASTTDLFTIPRAVIPPTFHPPSFGLTVLGNSHGFDKNGSTSGYVLWINGRGIMIDPPPYSSSTLEREGIRPQMIVAIIITHCHADHDAGAFQKVLTGSRVAIITTPTIYKSFIRKYAALSGLSQTLLRHSHRHRPAIIGQALKFQGAKFHFSYTLHTIPCIAFKVEWRGRSMVFTGDHLNSPPLIAKLEEKGVLTKGRADSLRQIPLQECDLLLHEAGAPPIHTPISVLQELPEKVRERLYIVHTSALPPDCGLKVAPTGTAGTIRLDQKRRGGQVTLGNEIAEIGTSQTSAVSASIGSSAKSHHGSAAFDTASLDDGGHPSLTVTGAYSSPTLADASRFRGPGGMKLPPLVFLRPTCVSDAWFILNLLSAVPFFSSLSYVNTMEVLEIAHVTLFCAEEVVVPADKRFELLCVVWEGTLVERDCSNGERMLEDQSDANSEISSDLENGSVDRKDSLTVWHAGDWTGPVALQPDFDRSADKSTTERPRDVVAVSQEGVKVITLLMKDLNKILKRGSRLYRKYQAVCEKQVAEENLLKATVKGGKGKRETEELERTRKLRGDNLLEVLNFNSALGKLTAFQKRHLESIAEGPRYFEEGSSLWSIGDSVDFAFLIVTGTALFGHKSADDDHNSSGRRNSFEGVVSRRGSSEFSIDGRRVEEDKCLAVPPNSEYARLETALQHRVSKMDNDVYDHPRDMLPREELAQNARDRFANKVMARLYSRRAYTSGLIFSRGHFLSDISRMVSGDLSLDEKMNRGHCHSSNMIAGRNGCVAMVFQRSTLVPFLEGNPGVLLILLGTHAVV
ncbi:Lactamase_B [Seminavis robusta]|uniref:Lactamase_B n=1 Tax=Seminavis robusta TaxID=568900 RepID=A0A9N8HRV2_9STRA|nr:Lactamase_B [Seminavis robusta]|eukprot:Sro1362_g266270.1 Lactamase_B (1333) ;mRNA; r:6305-10641